MTKIASVVPEFVEFIPERLEPGILYISRRFSTAAHLCCCGCGLEVVTPLSPAKWRLVEKAGAVSLSPSIGNWSFPCQSHYWIRGNAVQWAGGMSPTLIAAVKARDRADAEAAHRVEPGRSLSARLWSFATSAIKRMLRR